MKKQILFLVFIIILVTNSFAQWQQTGGPTGGFAKQIKVSGENIYVCSVGGGVFLSTNNGSSWTHLVSGLKSLNVKAITIKDPYIFVGTDAGIFMSSNGGNSWTEANIGITNKNILCLANDGTNIYAGTTLRGFYKSVNNGVSWSLSNSGLSSGSVDINCIEIKDSNIFAGTGDDVYLSTNAAAFWKKKNLKATTIALFINGSDIYAGTWGGGVYKSTDNGTNWTKVSNGMGNASITALAASGSTIFAATSTQPLLFVSKDNGSSWTILNTGIPTTGIACLGIKDNNVFAGSVVHGVFKTTLTGNSWLESNTGFTNIDVLALATNGANIYAGTPKQGLLKTADKGKNWNSVNYGLNCEIVTSLLVNGSDIYVGTGWDGIYKSSNNGSTWATANNGIRWRAINTMAVKGSKILAGTNDSGAYISSDNGANWSCISKGVSYKVITSFASSGSDLYLGCNPALFMTSNEGSTWKDLSNYIEKSTTVLSVLCIDPYVIVATNASIERSKNGPYNFDATLSDLRAQVLVQSGSYIFAGTKDSGIYLSKDTGLTWIQINKNLDYLNISSLLVDGTNLYAGTKGGGVWVCPISKAVGLEENSYKENIRLYPNPAKERVQIEVRDKSVIELFDIQGKKVKSLISNSPVTSFDLTNISSGIYFVKIRNNKINQTIKFIKE